MAKFKFGRADVAKYLTELDAVLTKVRPSIEIHAVRDSKDDMILECMVEPGAALIRAW